jgi:hypothetical protein
MQCRFAHNGAECGRPVKNADVAFYDQVDGVFMRETVNSAIVKAYWFVGKIILEKHGGEAKAA